MKERHKNLFSTLVQNGKIAELCLHRNILFSPFPTGGGKVCWDSFCVNGWKLQVNYFFGHWRVLNPRNERLSGGISEKQLEDFLNDRPMSVLSNYREPGYWFSRYTGNKTETVILIHGWGVRAASMANLAEMLHHAGYSVLNYDYLTSEKHIEEHAQVFLELYRQEPLPGKIHFLTHSMGGVLLRYALAYMTEPECRAIDSIVMLGPPNLGSPWAVLGKLSGVKRVNRSLGDMVPGSSALCIPKPFWLPPVGIIAGTLDGKVPLEKTGLPDGLPFQRTTVACTHPGLRDPANTGALILNFMQKKKFC